MGLVEAATALENGNKSPKALSAQDRDSFAYPTIKDRVPVIICTVIDLLHRQRLQLKLKDNNALKNVIELMSKLRYELQTNKPFREITDEREDENVWNEFMRKQANIEGEEPKWFNTTWMYAECYAYRRLLECTAASSELREHDYFAGQKMDAFRDNLAAIDGLTVSLDAMLSGRHADVTSPDGLTNDFRQLLETSLWGNKCDLSISAGSRQECSTASNEIESFRSKLLVDDWQKVWQCLMSARLSGGSSKFQRQSSTSSNGMVAFHDIVVDIVMDNAGYELFSDLCLADFLITTGLASLVRLRVKVHPWFVSDASKKDFDWVLGQICEGAAQFRQVDGSKRFDRKSEKSFSPKDQHSMQKLGKLAEKWKHYIAVGSWTLHSDPFWTYPHDYSLLKSEDPDLYSTLSEASLIIFKGDLNYRKLVGDLSWDPTTPFEKALQGFHPAPLVALRTLKADVVTGLQEGQAEKAEAEDKNWMINGSHGVIQFCDNKDN